MEILHLSKNTFIKDYLVVTIGQFDGIHQAHQKLITETVITAKQKNLKSAVITFNPHIDTILKNTNPNEYIISLEDKIEILRNLEVDYLLLIDFNQEVAKIAHQDFFREYLNNLNILHFIIGFDFSYGYKGLGNINTIKDDYIKDTTITVIKKLEYLNEKIGSLEIKKTLNSGNINAANLLLGYQFFMTMKVIKKETDRYTLTANNIKILNNQRYSVLINQKEYLLEISDNAYLFTNDFFNINQQIKVTFKN